MAAQRTRAALARQAEAPETREAERPDFDFVDMLWGFPVAVSAAHLNIPAVALTALAFVAQKATRSDPRVAEGLKYYGGEALDFTLQLLPFGDGIRKRLPPPPRELPEQAHAAVEQLPNAAPRAPDAPLAERLQRLPARMTTKDIGPWPTSRTAIPVGRSDEGQPLWLDLAANSPNAALHLGLYGQSGCGKDSLLRLWYTALCKRNSPQDVQFAIIDGKGDWLTEGLAHQPHMFIPPAGGYGAVGEDRILNAVQQVDIEATRRQTLITGANCRTREEYVAKTGRSMPILVVAATDVMTNVKDDVESLLVNLVSKARSLGIRVVVSMQTPSGKDTKWRMNLSTVIAGNLQAGSQDTPALGIEARDMRVRPSQLPSPQERPGVFVVKRGGEQHLVQAVYLPEEKFDAMCATFAPRTAPVVAARVAPQPSAAALGDTERLPKTEAFGDDDPLLAALVRESMAGSQAGTSTVPGSGNQTGTGTNTGSAALQSHGTAFPNGNQREPEGPVGTQTTFAVDADGASVKVYNTVVVPERQPRTQRQASPYAARKRGSHERYQQVRRLVREGKNTTEITDVVKGRRKEILALIRKAKDELAA